MNGKFNEDFSLVSIGSISLRLGEIRLSDIKMIHSENDIIAKIESELENDSLYKLIMDREQLKKELFHPRFISVLEKDIHRWYSVAEAGRIIGGDKSIPPSTLTYYIDNLSEYIIPDDAPSNKYIRLNYLSLIKVKMVLLLKDEFKLNGLRAELGLTGNPKHVTNRSDANSSSIEKEEEFNERMERLEAASRQILSLLMEPGEDGSPQLKKQLQSLLKSETLLIEEQSTLAKKLAAQDETIENLAKENEQLKERMEHSEEKSQKELTELKELIKKAEEQLGKKLEDRDTEKEKNENRKINLLTEQLRAKQQAEAEWDKQGLFKRLGGNRTEFVKIRTEAILKEKGIEEKL